MTTMTCGSLAPRTTAGERAVLHLSEMLGRYVARRIAHRAAAHSLSRARAEAVEAQRRRQAALLLGLAPR